MKKEKKMENKRHIRVDYIGCLNTIVQEISTHDNRSDDHLILDITKLSFVKDRVLKIDIITDEKVDTIYTNEELFSSLTAVKTSYLGDENEE